MIQAPTDCVVEKAEKKSQDMVHNYLMHDASDVHAPLPPLVDYKRNKKDKKAKEKKKKEKKSKKSKFEGHKSDTSTASDSGEDIEREAGSPVTFLLDGLRRVCPVGKCPRTFCSLQMYDVFEEWTDEQKQSYSIDFITAVRAQDLDTLRKWKAEGRILQAANYYGESLLHMACRRGFLDVVKFFVDEAGHNLWIRDDTGRTPLHDACWTAHPIPELVKFIIDKDPDMLLVSDKRGHTPLDYARKDHWKTWIEFLESIDKSTLLPRRDYFYTFDSTISQVDADGVVILDNVDEMFSQLNLENQPRSSFKKVITS
jgi:Ankyrin repeats (3 copies)